METIRFDIETEADPLLVLSHEHSERAIQVGLTPTGPGKFTGLAPVPANTKIFGTALFVGNPGTKYAVTVKPKNKVTGLNPNPQKSAISTSRPVGVLLFSFKRTS